MYRVVKISTDTLVLRTREKYWFFTAIHEIYLAFILNSKKLYMYVNLN